MGKLEQDIVLWHVSRGGFNGRIAGHALRLLHEAVELCVVSGATGDEIAKRVAYELLKAKTKKELGRFGGPQAIREELADVSMLTTVVAGHCGNVDLTAEKTAKLAVLLEREWMPDADGVLWRPGYDPRSKPAGT